MKIVHLTSSHTRNDSRVFHKMCTSCAQAGHEVTLVLSDGKGSENDLDLNIIDVGSSWGRISRLVINPIKIALKVYKYRNCIFHLHDPELLLISFFLRGKNNKIIFDMHENMHMQILQKEWIGNYFFRKILSKLYLLIETILIKRLDSLIVVQPQMKKIYSHMNKNIIVIHNYAKVSKSINHIKDNNLNKKNIIYAGGISEDRGLSNMIKLIQYLPQDYKLHIAGAINNQNKCSLNRINTSRIKIHGLLNRKDLFKLYEDCSIGLILFNNVGQYHMTYSLKLFEYMQFGLTILLPNFGQWVDFNATYKVGFNVNTKDSKACSEIIRNLSIEQLNSFKEANKSKLLKYFNWDDEFLRLEKHYMNLNLKKI